MENEKNEEISSSKLENGKRKIEKEKSDIGESSKKARHHYSFWKKNPNESENEPELKINQLSIGRYKNTLVKVRITFKSQPTEKILKFYGMDNTGKIVFIIFGKEGIRVDKELKVNFIYSLKNFVVEKHNDAYPKETGNEFQIKINFNTEINSLTNCNDFPEVPFEFTSLEEIKSLKVNSKIDIIGILTENYGLEIASNGTFRRDLSITDKSKGDAIVTLWSIEAQNFECEGFSIIILRNATLVEYEGIKKLNCISDLLDWFNKEISEIENKEEIICISNNE